MSVAGWIFQTTEKVSGNTYADDMNNLSESQYCGYIGETTLNSPIEGKYGRFVNICGQQIATIYQSYNNPVTYVRGRTLDDKFWAPWTSV